MVLVRPWYGRACSRLGICSTMDLRAIAMIKIRYQNGQAAEAITLSRSENEMRLAMPGTEDVLELRRLNGVWVTSDCEPVSIEYPSHRSATGAVREEDCICPADLAAHLIDLLFTDSAEDVTQDLAPVEQFKTFAAGRIA